MIVLEEKLYTSEETADILGINTRTLYRYLKKGDIEAETKTKSGTFRFSRNQIYKYLYPEKYEKILAVITKKENRKHTYIDNSLLEKVSEPDNVTKQKVPTKPQENSNSPYIKTNSPTPQVTNSNTLEPEKSNDDLTSLNSNHEPSVSGGQNPKPQESSVSVSQAKGVNNPIVNDPPNSVSNGDVYAKDLEDIISAHAPSKDKPNSPKFDNSEPGSQPNLNAPNLPQSIQNSTNSMPSSQPPQKAVVSDEEVMRIKKERENKNLDSELKNLEDSINGDSAKQGGGSGNGVNSDTEGWKYYVNQNKDILQLAKEVNSLSTETGRKYAATMKGGLSLHHDIDEFNQVHFYVEPDDLNWWVSHLELSYSQKTDSNICLIPSKNPKLFEQSYKLRGLYVVPDEVLIQDLMKHGEKELAKSLL